MTPKRYGGEETPVKPRRQSRLIREGSLENDFGAVSRREAGKGRRELDPRTVGQDELHVIGQKGFVCIE